MPLFSYPFFFLEVFKQLAFYFNKAKTNKQTNELKGGEGLLGVQNVIICIALGKPNLEFLGLSESDLANNW